MRLRTKPRSWTPWGASSAAARDIEKSLPQCANRALPLRYLKHHCKAVLLVHASFASMVNAKSMEQKSTVPMKPQLKPWQFVRFDALIIGHDLSLAISRS